MVLSRQYFPGDDLAGGARPDADTAWPDLDREGLLRRTFGDRDLARELLDLFEAQCLRVRPALVDGVSCAEALHTLRGAALAVGAERVAHLASGGSGERPLEELVRALDDVVNVIRSERPPR